MVRPLVRRLIAAACAAGAVGFALSAVRPAARPEPGARPGSLRPSAGSLLDGRPGQVAVPVRIADAGAARLLHPGDRIDVLAVSDSGDLGAATGPPRTIGTDLTVLAVPTSSDGDQGALVVLAADRFSAAALAAAGSHLAVTILPR